MLHELLPELEKHSPSSSFTKFLQTWGETTKSVLFSLQKWLPRIAPRIFEDENNPDFEDSITEVMDSKNPSKVAETMMRENLTREFKRHAWKFREARRFNS